MLDTLENIESQDNKEKPKLWAHQETAKNLALETDGFGLFMSLGTGKTATTIHILSALFKRHGGIKRTLILCPPIVIRNWQREFAMHSDIGYSRIIPLVGPGKDRLQKLVDANYANSIFITNYESLIIKPLWEVMQKSHFDILILDELHKVKDIKAKRTKACIQLADKANYRYGLTGTPVLNSPMDLYSQFRILDLGKTFGKSFIVFRSNYFYDANANRFKGNFPEWKVKPGALEQINATIRRRSYVVTKEECLTLPPLIRKEYHIELSSEQKRHYDSMRKDLITYVKGEACLAKIALTKSLRLLQIVSGFITVEGENGAPRKDLELPNARIEALEQLFTDIPSTEKIIVWATFRQNYKQISALCDKMRISYKTLIGDDSAKAKDDAVLDFMSPLGSRVLIANPGAGGVGINLTSASYMIYYSRGFSLEHDIQSESRNHRAGSEIHKKITRIDLITPNSIDEFVAKRLFQKQSLSDTILLDYLRKGF